MREDNLSLNILLLNVCVLRHSGRCTNSLNLVLSLGTLIKNFMFGKIKFSCLFAQFIKGGVAFQRESASAGIFLEFSKDHDSFFRNMPFPGDKTPIFYHSGV